MASWGTIWTAVAAIAELLTAAIALLVLREAARIRRVEWLAKSHEMWQAFNTAIVVNNFSDRFEAFRRDPSLRSNLDSRDKYFIYMYMNVVHVEFEALRNRLIQRDYAFETIIDSCLWLKNLRDDVSAIMRDGGYDDDFVQIFEVVSNKYDRSEMTDFILDKAKMNWPWWAKL